MIKFSVFFMLFFFLVSTGCKQSREKQESIKVDSLVKKIHFQNVIESIQNTIKIQLSTMRTSVGEKIFHDYQKAAERAYSSDSLKNNFKKYLKIKADSLDLDNFLNWLNSPLYQKISKADSRELTEEDIQALIKLSKVYENDSTLLKRYNYIQSAVRHEETELTADAYASTFRALIEANRRFVNQKGKLTAKDVDFIVKAERENFLNNMYEQAFIEKLFRYQDITDEELIQIAEFKHTSTGKNATVFIHKAILYAVKKANLDFLYRVSRINI